MRFGICQVFGIAVDAAGISAAFGPQGKQITPGHTLEEIGAGEAVELKVAVVTVGHFLTGVQNDNALRPIVKRGGDEKFAAGLQNPPARKLY